MFFGDGPHIVFAVAGERFHTVFTAHCELFDDDWGSRKLAATLPGGRHVVTGVKLRYTAAAGSTNRFQNDGIAYASQELLDVTRGGHLGVPQRGNTCCCGKEGPHGYLVSCSSHGSDRVVPHPQLFPDLGCDQQVRLEKRDDSVERIVPMQDGGDVSNEAVGELVTNQQGVRLGSVSGDEVAALL